MGRGRCSMGAIDVEIVGVRFDASKVSVVPIETVFDNDWDFKDRITHYEYMQVKSSIRLFGQRQPLYVREVDGRLEVFDGGQRLKACRDLGFKEVCVYNEGVMPDSVAKVLAIWYQLQVPMNEAAQMREIARLLDKDPNVKLPVRDSEIEVFKKLLELTFDDYDKKGKGDSYGTYRLFDLEDEDF